MSRQCNLYRLAYEMMVEEQVISSPTLDYYFKSVWVPAHVKYNMEHSKKLLNLL